ncbi:hypothetical protein RDI58_001748 [Solanum bulbocastanum]|uniref:Uncharacterized protein n=1 Tax=Solanum bulbocastanum TaxID=147425 RepID=A0AAN8U5M3_SOLBU
MGLFHDVASTPITLPSAPSLFDAFSEVSVQGLHLIIFTSLYEVEAFGPCRAVVELVSEFCCENLLGKLGEPIASLSQLSIENIDDLGNSASFDGNSDGL